MKKTTTGITIVLLLISAFTLSVGFAADNEELGNIAGILRFLRLDPPLIEVVVAKKNTIKFTWSEETIFYNWEEEEIKPKDFYRLFKDSGVQIFFDGKEAVRIEPAVF